MVCLKPCSLGSDAYTTFCITLHRYSDILRRPHPMAMLLSLKQVYGSTILSTYIITCAHVTHVALFSFWRLKSPASRLFTQSFIRAQIKEYIKAPRHWPLCGEFTGTGEFPAQRASNAENVSIWWRHHDVLLHHLDPSYSHSFNGPTN